jgi:hypothetical protein
LRPRPRRRWSGFSWAASLALFVVPLLLVVATFVYDRAAASDAIVLTVRDLATGDAVAGAQIEIEGQQLTTGDDGSVELPDREQVATIVVRMDGYEPKHGTLTPGANPSQEVSLRPTTVSGLATDAESGDPIVGATVRVVAPQEGQPATTGEDGRYQLSDVPAGATIQIEAGDFGVARQTAGDAATLDFALAKVVLTGQITDPNGAPLAGATVRIPNGGETTTDAEGRYSLAGANGATEVIVTASGFEEQTVAVVAGEPANAQLAVQVGDNIKALYANLGVLSEQARLDELIRIADQTEINAIVIDVKQDTIYYDTQVQFFRDIDGVVRPFVDLPALLARLDEHGIYSIARMVVFKDPLVAEGRPDLAVRDEVTGGVWRDFDGASWVNAFNSELWEANAALAAELATIGFDEVQYDYIRFPSDGDLTTADFGPDYSEAARRAAITSAVRAGNEATHAAGAEFSIDLFPIVALMGDDQGIGQTVQDLAPHADYVCLMVYPSHYGEGNIPGVTVHPNDAPAETVRYTLERAEELVPGTREKMRPWLQDFTYPLEGFSEYGPAEVRAQIDAAEALGVNGWMLWNAAGQFQESALAPE